MTARARQPRTHTAADLEPRLADLARLPVLLVATDYDGTMAPIVDNPIDARPLREAMVALRQLAAMPSTHAAIVSGRSLADLAALTGEPEAVHLVGSHGSEFDLGFAESLDPRATALRDRLERDLRAIAQAHPGCTIEPKPAGVALHFRGADDAIGRAAEAAALAGPATLEGVHRKHGKMVLELSVVPTSKGDALNTLRARVGASAVIFLGDDLTDEDAFATLSGPDVSVKVGLTGHTRAAHRVDGPGEVARALARLCELRLAWLHGPEATPIEHHALLSDQRALALVTPDARVVWLAAPRIDSPPLFAELLGGPPAGRFTVQPIAASSPPTQAYAGNTLTLRTQWTECSVTDYLDCSGGRTLHRAGRTDLVRVVQGRGRVRIVFAPRPDFGRFHVRLAADGRGVALRDTVEPVVLHAPGLPWAVEREGPHETAFADADLDALGGRLVLDLRCGSTDLGDPLLAEPTRRRRTDRHWSAWARAIDAPRSPRLRPDLVRRSALTIRALVHGPSGAIAAAATTSLPECIGGVRNWDYRFCWPRDAALAASALVRLGSTEEAVRFLDWLLGVVERLPGPDRLSPIYTVTGGTVPAEGEVTELPGYAGSRPVRIGNAASHQLQLDVFGPVVELIHRLALSGAPVSSDHWRLLEAMVAAVDARWHEPDHGIWEIRGPQRHHVHSKVMCWQTAALAADLAERFTGRPRPAWADLRDRIAADILAHGWSADLGMFTGAYSDAAPDASVLHVGLSGLLQPTDPRFAATVRAVEQTLRRGDTVYRYRMDDGLPGDEGGFNICTGWLIESYALVGRTDDALRLFDAYTRLAGPTGLIPEEFDPQTRRGLGNHPQAYSHLALINAALRLDEALQPG